MMEHRALEETIKCHLNYVFAFLNFDFYPKRKLNEIKYFS